MTKTESLSENKTDRTKNAALEAVSKPSPIVLGQKDATLPIISRAQEFAARIKVGATINQRISEIEDQQSQLSKLHDVFSSLYYTYTYKDSKGDKQTGSKNNVPKLLKPTDHFKEKIKPNILATAGVGSVAHTIASLIILDNVQAGAFGIYFAVALGVTLWAIAPAVTYVGLLLNARRKESAENLELEDPIIKTAKLKARQYYSMGVESRLIPDKVKHELVAEHKKLESKRRTLVNQWRQNISEQTEAAEREEFLSQAEFALALVNEEISISFALNNLVDAKVRSAAANEIKFFLLQYKNEILTGIDNIGYAGHPGIEVALNTEIRKLRKTELDKKEHLFNLLLTDIERVSG